MRQSGQLRSWRSIFLYENRQARPNREFSAIASAADSDRGTEFLLQPHLKPV
jgi:hypothetical protein